MSKCKSSDINCKLKAVECATRKSKTAAEKEFRADTKQIPVWCSQKELIALKKKGKSRIKHLCGAGRKVLDVDMEETFFSWITDMQGCDLCLSRYMI